MSTGIKFAGFLLGAVTTAGAVLVATLKLAASSDPAGWRGSVALLFSVLGFAAGAFALVAVVRARFSRPAPATAAG